VNATTLVSAPALAYLARVPPAQTVSSSGWAKIPSRRVGLRPGVFTDKSCANRSPSNLPLAGHHLDLWIGQPVEGAPYGLVERASSVGAPSRKMTLALTIVGGWGGL
jgi:hypothetical protein